MKNMSMQQENVTQELAIIYFENLNDVLDINSNLKSSTSQTAANIAISVLQSISISNGETLDPQVTNFTIALVNKLISCKFFVLT